MSPLRNLTSQRFFPPKKNNILKKFWCSKWKLLMTADAEGASGAVMNSAEVEEHVLMSR